MIVFLIVSGAVNWSRWHKRSRSVSRGTRSGGGRRPRRSRWRRGRRWRRRQWRRTATPPPHPLTTRLSTTILPAAFSPSPASKPTTGIYLHLTYLYLFIYNLATTLKHLVTIKEQHFLVSFCLCLRIVASL